MRMTTGCQCSSSNSFNMDNFKILNNSLHTLRIKVFENMMEKSENFSIEHFLLFPQCFLPIKTQISNAESLSLFRL